MSPNAAVMPLRVQGASARAVPAARARDPERTVADILAVATREFADKGLAGARIDAIAAATRTSKRMIYYYFGSKEGLYVAALEEAYRSMRQTEATIRIAELEPVEALRQLVAQTFDYQRGHPDFVRLVMTENIHRGEFLARSKTIRELNLPAIDALGALYRRGVDSGLFRAGIDLVDLHLSISSLCFFYVANQHTFGLIFKRRLDSRKQVDARRETTVEMVLRYVQA